MLKGQPPQPGHERGGCGNRSVSRRVTRVLRLRARCDASAHETSYTRSGAGQERNNSPEFGALRCNARWLDRRRRPCSMPPGAASTTSPSVRAERWSPRAQKPQPTRARRCHLEKARHGPANLRPRQSARSPRRKPPLCSQLVRPTAADPAKLQGGQPTAWNAPTPTTPMVAAWRGIPRR